MELLWLTLNWHWFWLLVTVIISIAVMKYAFKVLGLLVLSLVLYLGVDWNMWSWVPPLFWIAWFGGLLFVVIVAISEGGVKLARLCAVLTTVIIVVAFIFSGVNALADAMSGDDRPTADDVTDIVEPDETIDPSETSAPCADTWRMKQSTPKNGDLVPDVPSIRQATTKAEAHAAAEDWAELVGRHPETLKAAASIVLDKFVRTPVLVGDDACATRYAENLVQEIKTELALSQITPAEAPATGYNTFTNTNTGEVYARHGAINGDRRAVKIVLRNGQTFWVMARCGNPVTKTPPPVEIKNPPDKNPPTDNPPEECPPGTVPSPTGCLKPAGQNDSDGAGGDESPYKDPVNSNPQGPTNGAGAEPPGPGANDPDRNPDDNGQSDHGSPGNGGAGPATGPEDNTHEDDQTGDNPDTPSDEGESDPSPECPFGPGNC